LGLQKAVDAEDVDMQAVHDSLKRTDGKEELRKMMQEMHATSRGEVPARGPAAPAPAEDEDAANPHTGAGAKEGKEQMSDQEEDEGDDDDDDDSDDEEDLGKGGLVPCTHEAILKASPKAITAISIDPSGARLLTGGHDCSIKMYDFNGMNQNLQHFRELAVYEGQPMVDMQYSNSGDKILVATTKNTAVVFGREGSREAEFAKGDMYVHDMSQTKGHIAALCAARWHPTDKNVCMTASNDGTVRLWDINTCDRKQVTVIKTKDARGQKAPPTAICYTTKGDIVAACLDGAIKVYDGRAVAKGSTQRAHNEAKTAHQPGSGTTCVTVSKDGNMMISRGGDDTLKVWDMRNLTKALAQYTELDNFFEQTQCIFSPGDHLFLTATSVRKNKDGLPYFLFAYLLCAASPLPLLVPPPASCCLVCYCSRPLPGYGVMCARHVWHSVASVLPSTLYHTMNPSEWCPIPSTLYHTMNPSEWCHCLHHSLCGSIRLEWSAVLWCHKSGVLHVMPAIQDMQCVRS